MSEAFDLDQPITAAMIPAMKAAGIKAVCRYTKNATGTEARLLGAAGMDLVFIWEAAGNLYASYTAAEGERAARQAVAQVRALGFAGPGVVYFCGADFDASARQVAGGIKTYFEAVKGALPVGVTAGVYGNGAVCAAMLDAGLATHAWLWGVAKSNGTAAFLASNRWAIHQHMTTREFGVAVDPDDLRGDDYGGWRLAA